jgi:hypothetical protein
MKTYGEHIKEIVARINEIEPPAIRDFIAERVLTEVIGAPIESLVLIDGKLAHEFEKVRQTRTVGTPDCTCTKDFCMKNHSVQSVSR